MSLFSIDTEEDFDTDFEGLTYRDFEGLMPSSFLAKKGNTKWTPYVTYFYERPQLGAYNESQNGKIFYPPKSNHILNRKVYAQRVGSVVDVMTDLPGVLKMLPTMRTKELDDRTILNTVVPQGKWSVYEDTGRPKPGNTMYLVVGLAKPGSGEMIPSVINMGVQNYEKLSRQLEEYERTSQAPVVGLPWKIEVTSDKKLEVTPYLDEPAQVMNVDELVVAGTDVSLIEQHVDALRYHYEQFLLGHGWECDEQTHDSGVILRRNWRMTSDADDAPFIPDPVQPRQPDEPATGVKLDELTSMKVPELRAALVAKGIEAPKSLTRKAMIALLNV